MAKADIGMSPQSDKNLTFRAILCLIHSIIDQFYALVAHQVLQFQQ